MASAPSPSEVVVAAAAAAPSSSIASPSPSSKSSPPPTSRVNANPSSDSSAPPASSPPPASSTPPPSVSPPPEVSTTAPPPASSSPPPPIVSSPPPVPSTPPTTTLSPPPPSAVPPTASPPPATISPPPAATISPPPSSNPVTPPPPSAMPPTSSPSPPKSATAPKKSPSPPVAQSPPKSPKSSPSPPVGKAAPPSRSPSPPNTSQTPLSSPASPNPINSSAGGTPSAPPLPPAAIAGDPTRPSRPGSNISSSFGVGADDNNPPSGGLSAGAAASIVVVIGLLVLSFVGAAVWYVRKRKRQIDGYSSGFVMPSTFTSPPISGESPNARPSSVPPVYSSQSSGSHRLKSSATDISLGTPKSWFSYEELYDITNGFSAQNLLGEGGFGSVYKGCLSDGREVAVKQLKDGGGQGEREFQAEVEIISRVHHRHLVSLVGYCISEEQRLLVYDFVPNNTLHYHLHGNGRPVMEWAIRVKIAAGAARGIAYLHEDCHPRIIHRDIKSSNILLDNNFDAQVADFGLARLAMDSVTHVTTRVMGTFGYLAPEYASSGKLTERSDVFSFGVVLLELITGRKPVDASLPLGDESLVEWARPLLTQVLETRNFEELVDPRLEKNYNEVEMTRMIEAAAACVRHSASRRPRMSQVVRVLDILDEIDINNGVQPGKSELFNVADTAEIRLFQRMAFGSQNYSCDFSQSSLNSRRDL